jgi:hypothetical protein
MTTGIPIAQILAVNVVAQIVDQLHVGNVQDGEQVDPKLADGL